MTKSFADRPAPGTLYPRRSDEIAVTKHWENAMRLSPVLTLLIFVCFSAFGQETALAVVEKISGFVGFYSPEGKRLTQVKVGTHPHEMVLSPDKRLLYVTDNGILWMTNPGEGGNTISIVDVVLRKKVGVIDLGGYRRPHGIDVVPNSGHLLVTVENPDGLLLIDQVSRKILRRYDVKGEDPHMVLLGRGAEWAYVSNTGSGTLAAIHLKTGNVKLIPTGARPQGAALSQDGKFIYVTNLESDSISVINTEKKERVGVINTGKGPMRIALTPDGSTLVYGLQPGEAIGFADVAAKKEVAQVGLGGRPVSLTMSPDGQTAYSGVQEQDKIFVISIPNRKVIRVIQSPNGAGPDPVLSLR